MNTLFYAAFALLAFSIALREIMSLVNRKKEYEEVLRNEFAMAALTSIIGDYIGPPLNPSFAKGIAKDCFLVADAMMEARK